ncbi:MAG: stage VI sporulation protein F [Tenericutes bacterium]|mgnify:CR=1 FL=1|nr:stage VI sporulation protein F [Mycoplasmatota bacterium]
MGFSDSFFNKIEKKTNINKDTIVSLASRLKDGNLKDKDTLKSIIDDLSKMTGKNVSEEQSNKIISAIVNDKVPNNIENMID